MEQPKRALAHISRRGLAAAGLGFAAATAAPAMGSARKAARIPVDDRMAIQDLFTDYLWAYDCSDAEGFLALFAPDAVVIGKGIHYKGHAKISGWFDTLIALRKREQDDAWLHEAGQFRFAPSDKGWLAYAYATHFNANSAKGTRGVRSLGYFICECRKAGDHWAFQHFSISPWDPNTLPWKKPLPWAGV